MKHLHAIVLLTTLASVAATSEPLNCNTLPGFCGDGRHCEMVDGRPTCVQSTPAVMLNNAVQLKTNGTECATNEEFFECGTACEPSCADEEHQPKMCTMQCIVNVCQCSSGFMRNFDGNCVEPEKCDNNTAPTSCDSMFCPMGTKCTQADIECAENATCPQPPPVCIAEATPEDPCAALECGEGFMCKVDKVMCFVPPCHDIASCVPETSNSTVCATNEEFRECGTACEPSCADDESKPKMCTMQCISNVCQCKSGFARNFNGECVERMDCDNSTGTTCDTMFCPVGTKCTQASIKCATNMTCPQPPSVCIAEETPNDPCAALDCQEGFVCKKEKVMCFVAPCDEIASCVPEATNSTDCTANEEFRECGTACEPSCADDVTEPKMCTDQCILNVCQCRAGFVRNLNGTCVEREMCDMTSNSTICAANEEFRECGTACEPSCADDENEPKMCTMQCILNVCQCKSGLARNSNGDCVERKMCDMTTNTTICATNEEFRECGTACEPSCADDESKPKMCTMQCIMNVCQCKSGFARNFNGDCVERLNCDISTGNGTSCETMSCPVGTECEQAMSKCVPGIECPTPPPLCIPQASNTTKCGMNERFLECGSACEPSCLEPSPEMCIEQCLMNVCQCQSGFVRDTSKGKCVKQEQCMEKLEGCDKMKCPKGTKCHQAMKGAMAGNMPSSCRPDHALCDTVRCASDTYCDVIESDCTTPPCDYMAECVKKPHFEPCGGFHCLENYTCVEPDCDQTSFYCRPKCVHKANVSLPAVNPTNRPSPCEDFECPEGLFCKFEPMMVFPTPSCVEEHLVYCAQRKCPAGTKCQEPWDEATGSPLSPSSCEPVENSTACDDVRCNRGESCQVVVGTAVCVEYGKTAVITCAMIDCEEDHTCIDVSDVNCFVPPCEPLCIPNGNSSSPSDTPVDQARPPCEGFECPEGEICQAIDMHPTCVKEHSTTSCANVRLSCNMGEECGMVDGTPVCVKSNHTGSINPLPGMSCSCAAVTCMVGSQCVESRGNGSCSAQCVPIKQDNLISDSTVTCANVRMTCMDGEECGIVNGTPQCVKVNGTAGASQCKVNEEFSECVKCEGDCGEQIACPRWCNPGCHCKLGFVRSFATGGCVLEEECKPQTTAIPSLTTTTHQTTTGNIPDCDKKEVWNGCGGCEPTCNNTEPICNRMCSPGRCVCGPGLVRFEGNCVPFHKCPKEENTNSTCGPNEIETDCMPKCETTCRGIEECNVEISADACVPGCVCRANYKRNKFGRCTHRSQCYKKVNCHKHESWNKCMPCEANCSRLDQENCAQSCFSGCACDEGYARNDDNQCVPIKKCDV